MKKFHGFRLGKKIAALWNCCWWRAKPRRYLRFVSDDISDEPSRYLLRDPPAETPAARGKIFSWVQCLARRLRRRRSATKPPPKGHLAVYVGREGVDTLLHRVVVPVFFFNHPLFGELLRNTLDEFDYCRSRGGIVIPCPFSDFEHVRRRIAAAGGARCKHCTKAEAWLREF